MVISYRASIAVSTGIFTEENTMGLRINTNLNALNVLNNLQKVSSNVSSSIEKLSSGLRINSAADDPTGLTISEALRAQVDGINQAISNSQEATNLLKTAEGGLTEVNTLLRSLRQIAVHASNTGVNDDNALQADQSQVTAALASIDRISNYTQYGSKKLLDGTSGVSAATTNTSLISGINFGGTFGGVTIQNGTVNVTVNNAATRAQATGSATYASVNATIATVGGGSTGSGGSIVINGQTVQITGADTVQALIDKINNAASTTGVSANFSAANGSGSIILTQQNYGGNFNINLQETSNLIVGTSGTSVTGSNATVTVTASGLVNGVVTSVVSTFVGGRSTTDSGLRITDTYGNSILLTEQGNTTSGSSTNATVAIISNNDLQFQIGANAGQIVRASLGDVRTGSLGATILSGQNLSTINVTTASGSTNALQIIDNAITDVSRLRATIGSVQKHTLESVVRSLGTSAQNITASESQIRDTNVASEVVNYSKNQIIQQAAQSVLAQANSAPNQVLALLRQ